MTVVKFSRLISCSSEDPKFPASNLLNSELGKSWKCKDPMEKQLVVILQLEQSCKISSIDIGNENSAFVEIFVGKSATPDIYEVLRVASILMTVQEAKKGENKNAVRFFKYEEFSKPIVDQSWDRIKITCTQPFNKQIQYGLSFVKVHTKDVVGEDNQNNVELLTKETGEDKTSSQKEDSRLGKFSLKQDRNDISDVPIGSFFARRNDIRGTSGPLKGNSLSAAASIRVASKNSKALINTNNSKRLGDLIPDFKDKKRKGVSNDDDDTPNTNNSHRSITGPLLYVGNLEDSDLESKKEKESNQLFEKKTKLDKKNATPTKNTVAQSLRTSRVNSSQSKNRTQNRNKVKRKPFRKLLEGVVFVISGFQNPYRSELRSKAINMGAIYKADWSSACTHLLCAFPNTPKAAAVKGKGWILRKDWIEDCYSQRKRLLCDGYKLEKNDTYNNVNDKEIWEDFPEEANASDSSEKIEEVSLESLNSGYFPNNSSTSKKLSQKEADLVNIYDVDTDIDGDDDDVIMDIRNDYETVILPVLPDFFADKKFYFGTDISESALKILERYIIGYKGDIVTDVNETNYIISEDTRYKENIQNFPVALPDWVWECNDQKRLVPIDSYLL